MNEDVSVVASSGVVGGGCGSRTTTLAAAVTTTAVVSSSSGGSDEQNPTKKVKLEVMPAAVVEDDLQALKRRILEHKYQRLRAVKDKYFEHVAEIFYLQSNGSMMEYPTWRKKANQSQPFLNYARQHRLDHSQLDDLAVSFFLPEILTFQPNPKPSSFL